MRAPPVRTSSNPAAARPELPTGPVLGSRPGVPPERDGGLCVGLGVVRLGVAVAVVVGVGDGVTVAGGRVAVTVKAVVGSPKSEL